MNERQIEFLYKSLEDKQATIRALDTKVGALLVILILPLGNLDAVLETVQNSRVNQSSNYLLFLTTSILAVLAWLMAIASSFRTLVSRQGTLNTDDQFTRFYLSSRCRTSFWDFWKSKSQEVAGKDLLANLGGFPKDDESIALNLVFELQQLTRLRQAKLLGVHLSFSFFAIWFALSGLVLLMARAF